MNEIKSYFTFKIISLFLICTLLSSDISWSNPSLTFLKPVTAPTISGQGIFQEKMLTQNGETFRESIAADAVLQNIILDIAKYLYDNQLPISALDTSLTCAYEKQANVTLEYIFTLEYLLQKLKNPNSTRKAPKYIQKNDILALPYNPNNIESLLLVAKKASPSAQELQGETLFESNKYVIKLFTDAPVADKAPKSLTKTAVPPKEKLLIQNPEKNIISDTKTAFKNKRWGKFKELLKYIKNSEIMTSGLTAVLILPNLDEFLKKYPEISQNEIRHLTTLIRNLRFNFSLKHFLIGLISVSIFIGVTRLIWKHVICVFNLTSSLSARREKAAKKLKLYEENANKILQIQKYLSDLKFRDTSEEKQEIAWKTLGNMSNLSETDDLDIKKYAVKALGRILAYKTNVASSNVKDIFPVAWEISKFGDLAIPEIARSLLTKNNELLQYSGIIALGFLQIEENKKLKFLEKILLTGNVKLEEKVQHYALGMIWQMSRTPTSEINITNWTPFIRSQLKNSYKPVRHYAKQILNNWKILTAIDSFDKALADIKDPDQETRSAGITALGQINYTPLSETFHNEACTILKTIALHPKDDPATRLSAVEALLNIGAAEFFDCAGFLRDIIGIEPPIFDETLCLKAQTLLKKIIHSTPRQNIKAEKDTTAAAEKQKKPESLKDILSPLKKSKIITCLLYFLLAVPVVLNAADKSLNINQTKIPFLTKCIRLYRNNFTLKNFIELTLIFCFIEFVIYIYIIVSTRKKLSSSNIEIRNKTTIKLEKKGKFSAQLQIKKYLADLTYKDTSPEEQLYAWQQLGNFSASSNKNIRKKAVSALGQLLHSITITPSDPLKYNFPASRELAKFGELAIPKIKRTLFTKKPEFSQYGAITALDFLEIDSSEKITILEKALFHKNTNEYARKYALKTYLKIIAQDDQLLFEKKVTELVPHIRKLLVENNFNVRSDAEQILETLGEYTEEDMFTKALADVNASNHTIKNLGIAALGRIKYPDLYYTQYEKAEFVLEIAALVSTNDIETRLLAAETLQKIKSEKFYNCATLFDSILTKEEGVFSTRICQRAKKLQNTIRIAPANDQNDKVIHLQHRKEPKAVIPRTRGGKDPATVTHLKHITTPIERVLPQKISTAAPKYSIETSKKIPVLHRPKDKYARIKTFISGLINEGSYEIPLEQTIQFVLTPDSETAKRFYHSLRATSNGDSLPDKHILLIDSKTSKEKIRKKLQSILSGEIKWVIMAADHVSDMPQRKISSNIKSLAVFIVDGPTMTRSQLKKAATLHSHKSFSNINNFTIADMTDEKTLNSAQKKKNALINILKSIVPFVFLIPTTIFMLSSRALSQPVAQIMLTEELKKACQVAFFNKLIVGFEIVFSIAVFVILVRAILIRRASALTKLKELHTNISRTNTEAKKTQDFTFWTSLKYIIPIMFSVFYLRGNGTANFILETNQKIGNKGPSIWGLLATTFLVALTFILLAKNFVLSNKSKHKQHTYKTDSKIWIFTRAASIPKNTEDKFSAILNAVPEMQKEKQHQTSVNQTLQFVLTPDVTTAKSFMTFATQIKKNIFNEDILFVDGSLYKKQESKLLESIQSGKIKMVIMNAHALKNMPVFKMSPIIKSTVIFLVDPQKMSKEQIQNGTTVSLMENFSTVADSKVIKITDTETLKTNGKKNSFLNAMKAMLPLLVTISAIVFSIVSFWEGQSHAGLLNYSGFLTTVKRISPVISYLNYVFFLLIAFYIIQFFVKSIINKISGNKSSDKKNIRALLPFLLAIPTVPLIINFFQNPASAQNLFEICLKTEHNPGIFTLKLTLIIAVLAALYFAMKCFFKHILTTSLEEDPETRMVETPETKLPVKTDPPIPKGAIAAIQKDKLGDNAQNASTQLQITETPETAAPHPKKTHDKTIRLLHIAKAEANNIRVNLVKKTNAIRNFLKSIDGFTQDLRPQPLTKKDLSEEIRQEIGKTLQTMGFIKDLEKKEHFAELANLAKVPAKIDQDMEYITKHLHELEPASIINSLIALARLKQQQNKNLIVAFETDWIPNKDDQLQHNLLFPLFKELLPPENKPKEMCRLEKRLKDMGLDNVFFVHSTSENLAAEIMEKAKKTSTELSDIIAMGSDTTINAATFSGLKSTPKEKRAFIASINTSKIKFCKDGNQQLIQKVMLVKMLSLTIELAIGLQPTKRPPIIANYDEESRIVFLLPDADFFEYDKLRVEYKAEAQAFTSL
ncbi:MAG: HEAT repeat domain-containing protein [Candidatus Omnitrophota bacterium]